MKPLQKKVVFPPEKIKIDVARLSYWNELSVLLSVITFFVALSLCFSLSSDNLDKTIIFLR